MIKNLVLATLVLLSTQSYGQGNTLIEQINFYADVTATAGLATTRTEANTVLTAKFEEWISSEQFDDEALDDFTYMSVKRPADRSFAIVTWQLINAEEAHEYSGYIITKDGKVTKLSSQPVDNPRDFVYETLGVDQWYGALYYNIMETKYDGQQAYLLFGYNGHEGFEHRKVLDVLRFRDSEVVFGAELFKKEPTTPNQRPEIYTRVLLEYSSDANVSINYNEGLGMITADHLISRMGRNPGQGPTMVPDGSYIGYKWDGTYWNYVDKIYDQVSQVPPTDGRKKESNKTIIGTEKVKRETKKRD